MTSIEPEITRIGNAWMTAYGLDFKEQHLPLNQEIDSALNKYVSKNGGQGPNRPDAKLLLTDKKLRKWPILIEYKGLKDKLVKLDASGHVENETSNGTPHYTNIKNFAVNGAIHYANAVLEYTSYSDVIAIGMTGYKDSTGNTNYQIGVYYVSRKNLGIGQEIGCYDDFSFLAKPNFEHFITQIELLQISREELMAIQEKREKEISQCLTKLHNDIYKNENGLGGNRAIHLVAASIMATLGVSERVAPLTLDELKSSPERDNTDGDILVRKIKAFLSEKCIPQTKMDMIVRTLSNTLMSEQLNKVENGESRLKRIFRKIVDDLGFYYKIGLSTDFTGKLFNEMYTWCDFKEDEKNDVVLTPPYVARLLSRLARVNKDSYVWDFATGSAGLLVAAMNEMLDDAREHNATVEKIANIKAKQILGIEKRDSVYMLAILNMILMGDGSSNILRADSLKQFDGNYAYGSPSVEFPATALVLNPPYSAEGHGMIFVKKALSMMQRGYAAIIIQNSAGSGKAINLNKEILRSNTLLASIKMPADLFAGRSNVQTYVYVFRVGEAHLREHLVKFINFSDDGYARTARKKATSKLQDVNHAKERYDELVNLVLFGRSKLNLLSDNEYHESTINPEDGADWNQKNPKTFVPCNADFAKGVANYLTWKTSNILNKSNKLDECKQIIQDFCVGEIFECIKTPKVKGKIKKYPTIQDEVYTIPLLSAGILNQGCSHYAKEEDCPIILSNVLTISANGANSGSVFYQSENFAVKQDAYAIRVREYEIQSEDIGLYLATALNKSIASAHDWSDKAKWEKVAQHKVFLPVKLNEEGLPITDEKCFYHEDGYIPDFEAMGIYVARIKKNQLDYIQKTALFGGVD